MNPVVSELEELAFRAWPAGEILDVDGWRARYTHGVTRRANSVWPGVATGTPSLGARVEAVEAFYGARSAPARFQLSEAAVPARLDAFLAERGYAIEAPVSVQTLGFDAFKFAGQPPQLTTRVDASPGDDWFHVSVERGRFAGQKDAYAGILGRLGNRAGFAVARRSGKAVAIGLGVVEGAWLGVFNMATLPEERRQHAATAVLGALVGWASARGATRAYLQVERENTQAIALYRSLGFASAYAYHYRVAGQ